MRTGVREYQSEFARKYFSQGQAEGEVEGRAASRAEDVLAVLDARGIDVPEADRARISRCRDLDQLGVWLRRAVTADSVADLG